MRFKAGDRTHLAHLLGYRPKPAASPTRPPSPRSAPRPATSRAYSGQAFAHLIQPVAPQPVPSPAPTPSSPTPRALAAQIVAAGQRARQPTGTGVPKPTGVALAVINAGRKRRGEEPL
jgi:hypothetical protein